MQLRQWGLVDYATTYQAMQDFTASRGADTPDEIWLCEHPAVFTQGLALRPLATAFCANRPAANITEGFEVLVQEVIDAMVT